MSKAWVGGNTRRWRMTRSLVLERDGFICQIRNDGCTQRATQVHHTIGKEYGDDPAYLLASCETCNKKIGKPQGDPEPKVITEW